MENDEDKLLNEGSWKLEAQAVINDIKDHVIDVKISDILYSTSLSSYLNLTTLENSTFCIELSKAGYTIVGNKYDQYEYNKDKKNEYFETIQSLLNFISPGYRSSFDELLLKKLKQLC